MSFEAILDDSTQTAHDGHPMITIAIFFLNIVFIVEKKPLPFWQEKMAPHSNTFQYIFFYFFLRRKVFTTFLLKNLYAIVCEGYNHIVYF